MSEKFEHPDVHFENALSSLREHLLTVCGRHFDDRVVELLEQLEKTFLAARKASSDRPVIRNHLEDDEISRNYVTGQCAHLLAFANYVGRQIGTSPENRLSLRLNQLWSSLDRMHQKFFGDPFCVDS